ncbi:Zn-dependent hydrolase [Aestuariispira insulae]|uniref:N-carbamoyl-L-amino-acid hydrolase n=1 Tax=Aestuariispira insulae TaxID=1461337 RepID=A0A3D9HA32_9PROT|nr:Zn-dependent hydrolase [Aestuariispira insulae]RED45816.1 N-carbamoyl-L-amino-acid hydrolase [Aestuariispira insulae]
MDSIQTDSTLESVAQPVNRLPEKFHVNVDRLRDDLDGLNTFGCIAETGGISRTSFSDADMEGRRWLMAEMEKAGLSTRMDAVGNVFGLWPASNAPVVMTGSHLDTVPNGGRFDGTLGVLAGLEAVRSLKEQGFSPRFPIEILATSEEEGRFGGMLGSQALAGAIDPDWLETTQDDSGTLLKDAMAQHGLDARQALQLKYQTPIRAFIELHIEQGPVLDRKNIPVGIVEGISGCANYSITLSGRSNHAGTTPMDMRADAFAGLAEFASAIPQIIEQAGSDQSRLTIGQVELKPNYPHTIPGRATFTLILRDMEENIMTTLAEICAGRLSDIARHHDLQLDIRQVSWLSPVPCNPDIQRLLADEADHLSLGSLTMPSGAGHDCQFMANLAPSGMIFVPSINGVSHSPLEDTNWRDIEAGARLLANALARLAS